LLEGAWFNVASATMTDNVTAASGTASRFIAYSFQRPAVAAANSSVTTTNAATVFIASAPVAGDNMTLTNRWALWVDQGDVKFGNDIFASGSATIQGDINFNSPNPIITTGTTSLRIYTNTKSAELLRLTNDGTLALGTTVVDGAGSEIVLANSAAIRGVNFAGTTTTWLIGLGTSNELRLAGGSVDIQWGRALVALGGGSTATLGTIGGSGPATATQNTWMRVLDSTGTAFWLPAFK